MGKLADLLGRLSGGRGGRLRSDVHGLWADDAEKLAALEAKGADAGTPLSVVFFTYFAGQMGATAAAKEYRAAGLRVQVTEPSHGVDEWAVLVESTARPLLPDLLRDTVDLCERVVKAHKGKYEGWEQAEVGE